MERLRADVLSQLLSHRIIKEPTEQATRIRYAEIYRTAGTLLSVYMDKYPLFYIYIFGRITACCYDNEWLYICERDKEAKFQTLVLIQNKRELFCYIMLFEAIRDIYHLAHQDIDELIKYPIFQLKGSKVDWVNTIGRLNLFYLRIIIASASRIPPELQAILRAQVPKKAIFKCTQGFHENMNERTICNISQLGQYYDDTNAWRAFHPIPWNDGVIDIAYSWLARCNLVFQGQMHFIISENGNVNTYNYLPANTAIRYSYTL